MAGQCRMFDDRHLLHCNGVHKLPRNNNRNIKHFQGIILHQNGQEINKIRDPKWDFISICFFVAGAIKKNISFFRGVDLIVQQHFRDGMGQRIECQHFKNKINYIASYSFCLLQDHFRKSILQTTSKTGVNQKKNKPHLSNVSIMRSIQKKLLICRYAIILEKMRAFLSIFKSL